MDCKIVLIILNLCYTVLSEDYFTLGEFLSNEFKNIGWNATWVSESQLIYKGEKGDIIRHTFNQMQSEKSEVIINGNLLKPYKGATLNFSPDNSLVLVKYDVEAIFRHSAIAKYAIYDLSIGIFSDVAEKKQLQICLWSSIGNSLAYVFENNIYYVPNAKISTTEGISITTDGKPGEIYNGVPDWVYEEEVLGKGSAMWFSDDSQHLIYAKFIDTQVEEFTYPKYGDPGKMESQYPKMIKIRYPKVGRTNPKFEVHCVKLSDYSTRALDFLPTGAKSEDLVLNNIIWASKKDVIVYFYLNRQQTGMNLKRCDIEAGTKCVMEYEAQYSNKHGWINIGTPIYKDDGLTALFIKSQPEGDDFYPHIMELETRNGQLLQRTSGNKTILKIHAWDKATDTVYYEGTAIGKHWQKHVYSAIINQNEEIEEKCLTCDLDTPEGKCTYATATFSKDLSYYALICAGPGPTRPSIHRMANENIQIWEENRLIHSQLSHKKRPVVQDLSFTFKDDNGNDYVVRVRLLLPPQWKKNDDISYPMIVKVYAGPDSNSISDVFSTGFENYVTTRLEYIYAYIDGRGSGLNGDNNMYSIYRKLGTVEIQDQIRAVRKLQTDFDWIDPSRTCIWGWSYGGFSAAWALAQDTGDKNNKPVFKCGLSVAPVTNFLYYDSIYTERYMGLPTEDDNAVGYANTDLAANTDKFLNKKFFLIHGNADDNVHYQQSMLLARALELKDVKFEIMSYPDETHNLKGVYPHLYHIIDNFFRDSFISLDRGAGVSLIISPVLLTLSIVIVGCFRV